MANCQRARLGYFLHSNPLPEPLGRPRPPLLAEGRPHLLGPKWPRPCDSTILLDLGLICGPGVGPAPVFVFLGMRIIELIKEILSMKIGTEKVRAG